MIIIGEKINGAIPSVKQAIADRNADLIRERAAAQLRRARISSTARPVRLRSWNTMPWYG